MWIELCLCVFFTPWGHVNFYAQIWALTRHRSHVGSMLRSDWSIKNLLRSDWLQIYVACFTTRNNPDYDLKLKL